MPTDLPLRACKRTNVHLSHVWMWPPEQYSYCPGIPDTADKPVGAITLSSEQKLALAEAAAKMGEHIQAIFNAMVPAMRAAGAEMGRALKEFNEKAKPILEEMQRQRMAEVEMRFNGPAE